MSTVRKRFTILRGLAQRFYRLGNRLVVDFANTVVSADKKGDGITTWDDLVGALEAFGLAGPEQGANLRELGETTPEAAAPVLAAALELRGAVREALGAIAEGRAVPEESVDAVNRVLRVAEGCDQLVRAGKGWRLGFVEREQRLEWLLVAIARSAAEIIAEGPRAPLRRCGNPQCILYFYDVSRTGRRRWCQMAVCGNRAKVSAFARRQKEARRP
jgi:predicted RNA-binding Zn ribbon-like protein